MSEIVEVRDSNSGIPARRSERSFHFAQSAENFLSRILLAEFFQLIINPTSHRNLPEMIGLGVDRAHGNHPVFEIQILMSPK